MKIRLLLLPLSFGALLCILVSLGIPQRRKGEREKEREFVMKSDNRERERERERES